MRYLHAFSLAWALCTCVPLPQVCYPRQVSSQLQSLSVLFYPLVGLLLGVTLILLGALLPVAAGGLFIAVVLVSAWVLLTGAMHLDGLADSVDAYFASHKGGAVTLRVFKDPACGPMAVVALLLVILLKVAALAVLVERGQWALPLLLALVVSRWALFPFMAFTPYVREQGLAAEMHLKPYLNTWLSVSLVGALILLIIEPWLAVCFVAVALLCLSWRKLWQKKIGGFVGDCLGALVEMAEVLILLMAVLLCF